MNIARPIVYAACALGGVYIAAQLQPVKLDAGQAVDAARFDLGDFASDLIHGRWGEAKADVTGAGGRAAADAAGQVQGQVQNIVVAGVVGGCLVAALIDAMVLS